MYLFVEIVIVRHISKLRYNYLFIKKNHKKSEEASTGNYLNEWDIFRSSKRPVTECTPAACTDYSR